MDANNTSPVKPGLVPCECESGEEEHISIVYKEMKMMHCSAVESQTFKGSIVCFKEAAEQIRICVQEGKDQVL